MLVHPFHALLFEVPASHTKGAILPVLQSTINIDPGHDITLGGLTEDVC